MSYAYEIIQYNKAYITIGGGKLTIVWKEEVPDPSDKTGKRTMLETNPSFAKEASTSEIPLQCYFAERPSITVAQQWNMDSKLLQELAARFKSLVGTVVPSIRGLIDKFQKMDTEKMKGSSLVETGINVAEEVLGTLQEALGQESMERFMPATGLDWGGPIPIDIRLDGIFMKPTGAIYMSELTPLMNAVTFGSIDEWGNMGGPIGFNGSSFGWVNMRNMLRGKFDGLCSLRLTQGNKVIFDLSKILVLASVTIIGSEQLYVTDKSVPAYKWIKASIVFKTACPLPSPLAAKADKSIVNHTGKLAGM